MQREPQNVTNPYDYRQYDKIWQRVAPDLNPYPDMRAVPAADMTGIPQMPEVSPAKTEDGSCCMGPAAGEMLDVLRGFIEDELSDRRYYLAFCRQAPPNARQTLRDIAVEEGCHARQLMAVHYLITGSSYQPSIANEKVYIGPYCNALRERYHMEACGGLNYLRASDGTTDLCLQKLLAGLSEDEYCHAEKMMDLLEKAL